jgi:hypothetical protein
MDTTSTHDQAPNWDAFYGAMMDIGLESIDGLSAELKEWLRLESQGSDLLCIDDEREDFIESFPESPCMAVEQVYEQFVETVRSALRDLPFARGSEGWSFSAETGKPLSWGQSIEQMRGNLRGQERRALIAAAGGCKKSCV